MKTFVHKTAFVFCFFLLSLSFTLYAQGRPDLVWMRGNVAQPILSAAFTQDGKYLVTGDGYVKLWRMSDGMLLRTLEFGSYVATSPDSRYIVAAYVSKVSVWSIPDGKLVQTLSSPSDILSLVISPDGKIIAAGAADGKIRLWRTSDYTLMGVLTGHTKGVHSLSFSADSQTLASGGEAGDEVARVWNVANGTLIRTLPFSGSGGYLTLKFSPNGQYLAVGVPGFDSVDIYSTLDWKMSAGIRTGNPFTFDISPDNSTLLVSGDLGGNSATSLYRLKDGQPIRQGSSGSHNVTIFSPDGKTILVCFPDTLDSGNGVTFYNTSDLSFAGAFTPSGASGDLRNLAVSPDNRYVASAPNNHGSWTVRRLSDGKEVTFIPGDQPYDLSFSGDGSLLCTQQGEYPSILAVYHIPDGSLVRKLDNSGEIISSALSPDGRLVAALTGNTPALYVWSVSDGHVVKSMSVPGGILQWRRTIAFSPDGTLLALRTSIGVTLIRTSDWTIVRTLVVDGNVSPSFTFSSDGSRIATSGVSAKVWDVATGAQLNDFPSDGAISSVSLAAGGFTLAVGSTDGKIRLWDVSDGTLLNTYEQETGGGTPFVPNLVFSADGKLLLYGRGDGTLCAALNPYRNAVFPNHGGNTGNVTVKIVTSPDFPLEAGTTVKLTADGLPDIVPISTTVDSNSNFVMTATFALNGAPLGQRNVVITLPDGETRTDPQGFTIEQGVAPQLWVDIIGRGITRVGAQVPVHLLYGNSGNVDSLTNMLWATFPSNINWALPTGQEPNTVDTTIDSQTVVNFEVPLIPPMGGQMQQITLAAPPTVHGSYTARTAVTSQSGVASQLEPNIGIYHTDGGTTEVDGLRCATIQFAKAFQQWYGKKIQISGGNEKGHSTSATGRDHLHGYKIDIIDGDGGISGLDNLIGGAGFSSAGPFVSNDNFIYIGRRRDNAPQWRIRQGCGAIFAREGKGFTKNPALHWDVTVPESCGGAVCDSTPLPIFQVFAADPNYLAGSLGYGIPQWVSSIQPLRYAVYFDNEPEATAPVAEALVTDHLDATKLDMTTVNLQNITFADQTVTLTLDQSLPVGKRQFNADVDLRPTKNLIVHINANLDMLTGELTWHFTSLDPDTGMLPDDPNIGFLDKGQEGNVLFTVMLKQGLPTGTVVSNQASIKFDFNDWMDTPVWFNTIDNDAPISQVNGLAGTQNTLSFPVSWQGTDVGSGLRDFTIYVSDNGGAWTPWLTNTVDTSATFTGVGGHTYAFYSQARDNAFNIEAAHPTPDTTTRVAAIATDVSSQVKVTRGGFRLNRTTGRFVQTVTHTNTGSTTITGPVSLVLDGLSSNATLFNSTGTTSATTPTGSPYLDVQAGDLAAGTSVTVTLEFTNSDSKKGLTYTTRVLAGPGSR